jgi:hypothetical protein
MASMSPNFAARRGEIDPAYQLMRLLHAVGLIDLSRSARMPHPDRHPMGVAERRPG